MRTKVVAWNDVRVLVLSAGAAVCLYGVLAAFGVFPSVVGTQSKPRPAEHAVRLPDVAAANPVHHHGLTAKRSARSSTPIRRTAGRRGPTRRAGGISGGRTRTTPPASRPDPTAPQPASPTTGQPTAAEPTQPAPVSTTTALPAPPPLPSVPTVDLPSPPPPPPLPPISLPQVPQLPSLPQVPQLPVQLPGQ